MEIEQNIREAFDACAKVRNEKAKLYGNEWRMVDYYTLVRIIHNKLGSTKETAKDICTAVYNYSLFACAQLLFTNASLDELTKEEDAIVKLFLDEKENCIKNILSRKDEEYNSVWMHCPKPFLSDMMRLKVARLHYLRFRAQWHEGGRKAQDKATTEALHDLAGYAILYLARTALDEEREKKAKKEQTATTQAPKQ